MHTKGNQYSLNNTESHLKLPSFFYFFPQCNPIHAGTLTLLFSPIWERSTPAELSLAFHPLSSKTVYFLNSANLVYLTLDNCFSPHLKKIYLLQETTMLVHSDLGMGQAEKYYQHLLQPRLNGHH